MVEFGSALYLLHGAGGDENAERTGAAARSFDANLIATGKAKPMIVVMPNGVPIVRQPQGMVIRYVHTGVP